MLRYAATLCLTALFFSLPALSAESKPDPGVRILRIPKPVSGTEPLYNYVVGVLTAALESNSAEHGKVRLLPNTQVSVQDRQLRNLEHRLLDVTWSVTSTEREKFHRPIRVPLVNGLFGKRVFFINREDTRFSAALTVKELQSLRAVQGQDWPDTRIFRHNGYHVVEATYQSAFRMLAEHFVDYFPRGVLEITYEAAQRTQESIVIEPSLAVHYPSAMFFFVSHDNERLAKRIEEGMKNLVESGRLQEMLRSQPFYQQSQALLKGRTVFRLTNPLLSHASLEALETFAITD